MTSYIFIISGYYISLYCDKPLHLCLLCLLQQRKGKLGTCAMKSVAAGAHLATPTR